MPQNDLGEFRMLGNREVMRDEVCESNASDMWLPPRRTGREQPHSTVLTMGNSVNCSKRTTSVAGSDSFIHYSTGSSSAAEFRCPEKIIGK